jgi:hypothetical protein
MASAAFDIPAILQQHRERFRRGAWQLRPKMEYHVLADGVFWTDEFPANMPWDLENAFRLVINHRTSLLTGDSGRFDEAWTLAQKYFPGWIGFARKRCSFNAQLADRIARIRRVSNWRIEKLSKESWEDA